MAENSFFEKAFKLKKHGTDTRTEIMAGITTFMTMSYILAVNPQILSESGMDYGAVFTGTIIASVIAMLFMAFYANLPFGMSAGMGLNAFFTYTVVMQMGKTWQFALTAVSRYRFIYRRNRSTKCRNPKGWRNLTISWRVN